jgi:hypothetical protein
MQNNGKNNMQNNMRWYENPRNHFCVNQLANGECLKKSCECVHEKDLDTSLEFIWINAFAAFRAILKGSGREFFIQLKNVPFANGSCKNIALWMDDACELFTKSLPKRIVNDAPTCQHENDCPVPNCPFWHKLDFCPFELMKEFEGKNCPIPNCNNRHYERECSLSKEKIPCSNPHCAAGRHPCGKNL